MSTATKPRSEPTSTSERTDTAHPAVRRSPVGAAWGHLRGRWEPWALAAICALAALLYLWGIGETWGNTYYSAAVKSMLSSFENFFFGAFDPAGVVTVDKPPMALWVQAASALVFGYNAFAVLVPQVVAGVAAVFLLHRTVRRWAGEHAGLIAALVMALTPITVAINRDNNPDTLLVLFVVAAAYTLTRALQAPQSSVASGELAGRENGRVQARATVSSPWSWLVLTGFLVGSGFLTKMLQAWMVLPAFLATYLIARRAPWARKALELAVTAAILLASSLWWVAATALWPSPKPYIGGSTNGSAWDLVLGYNGFGRILGGSQQGGGGQGGPGGGGGFSGQAGILRLFNEQLAGQISWLLPLCGLILLTVAVAAWRHWRRKSGIDRDQAAGWALWTGWLLTLVVMFSFAQGTMHPYYTTMLAPAVGAVVGAGLVRFWRVYQQRFTQGPETSRWAWLLLPASVVITVAWAEVLVFRDPSWNPWVGYVAAGVGAVSLVVLLAGRFGRARLSRSALVISLAAVLAVPSAWSALAATSGQQAMGGANPTAGPATSMGGPGGGRGPGGQGPPGNVQQSTPDGGAIPQARPGARPGGMQGPGGMSGELTEQQRALLTYVQNHATGVSIALAVEGGSMGSSGLIINSGSGTGFDLTVIGMGGFTGSDDAPSVAQLTEWKNTGQLGFVLLGGGPGGMGGPPRPGGGQGGPGGLENSQRQEWVKQNCTLVDPTAYGGQAGSSQQLYVCR